MISIMNANVYARYGAKHSDGGLVYFTKQTLTVISHTVQGECM